MTTKSSMPVIAMLIATSVLTQTAEAQSAADRLAASPRHDEWVNVEYGDGQTFSAFIVYPESSEASDSVVVIHDILAMSDWARLVGDQLAENGYFAIVPDLLSGKGPDGGNTESFTNRGDLGRTMRSLDPDEVTARLRAAVKYARDLASTTNDVSVAGFCWGGSQTFRIATNDPTIKAAFVFYGSPPPADDLDRIACPVYGFYAENDNRINATLDDSKTKMAAKGKTFEPVTYGGVGHGFVRTGMGETASDVYRERTGEAWDRWLELLAK